MNGLIETVVFLTWVIGSGVIFALVRRSTWKANERVNSFSFTCTKTHKK
jgi:hypothetical protein